MLLNHRPQPSGAWVHSLVHCLAAKLMIGALVLLPIRPSEARLMAGLAVGARGAIMPIVDIESTRETHVLIREILNDVGEHWISAVLHPAVAVLRAGWNVRNRLIARLRRRSNSLPRSTATAARA